MCDHGMILTNSVKIDFTSLDQITLQPIGVYGSLPALVDFMEELGVVDEKTQVLSTCYHSMPRSHLQGLIVRSCS